jgi:protein-L-isoaspartate(D-aspartate) O-methyltransferase
MDAESESTLKQRFEMVKYQIEARGIRDLRVLEAMREIPRHLFVPEPYREAAYRDSPLPIGESQTISQPYIVALMTELLELGPTDRVLEIGTGSGYQAALLSRLAAEVVTVERLSGVADGARKNLAARGIKNVEVIVGDGTLGYPGQAPYQGIIITACAPEVPASLIAQLADGGRLVAPVGSRDFQELTKLVRHGGSVERSTFGGVAFVPLIGAYGWQE